MTIRKVYLFSTCLIEHLYPQVGLDAVALLGFCDIQVELPAYQSCCAQPAYNSGDLGAAKQVAAKTVEQLCGQNIPIVVPSASCADMLQHHLPKLLQDKPELSSRADSVAQRSVELLDFLAGRLPELPPCNEQITLHPSCSSLRGTRSHDAWKKILTRAGYSVVLPAYANECCGFGGTFSVKAPAISSVLAEDKCRHLTEVTDDCYYSGDMGCLMHLNGFAEKQKQPLQGKHLATLLRARYGANCG